MGQDFLPILSVAASVHVFQLPGWAPVPVPVWSTRLGGQSGGTPQLRDFPISSSHLGLPRYAPQCRLPLLTSVDVFSGWRPNSLRMLTTKTEVENLAAKTYWRCALNK